MTSRFVTSVTSKTAILLTLVCASAAAEEKEAAIGRWKTIDDSTNEAKGIVRTYLEKGELRGLVERILDKGHENDRCTKCTGKNKDRPIAGMVILWGLKRDGDGWSGGKIFDPENGKTYSASVTPEPGGKLKVRGYLGIPLLGRTQYWYRIKEEAKK